MNIVEDNNAKKMVVENEETQMNTSVSDGDDEFWQFCSIETLR